VNDTLDPRLTERLGGVWRAPVTRLASAMLAFVTLLAVGGPWLSPWAYDAVDWANIDAPPSASHWFGTDTSGRDLFTRICMGARTSLSVAALATAVSFAIGLPWGAVAGYLGGRVDQLMMRIVDVLYALPFVFVVIVLVVVFGRNIYLLFVALGAISWLDLARIVRGQTLSIRHETFVLAAQSLGATTAYIVRHHVARNVMGPALVYTTLTVPGVLLAESFLARAAGAGYVLGRPHRRRCPRHGIIAVAPGVSGLVSGRYPVEHEPARRPAARRARSAARRSRPSEAAIALRRKAMRIVTLCLVILVATGFAHAADRETRSLARGETSPPATLADVAWIAGRWVGEGFDAKVEEVLSPPQGDAIGHFRTTNDLAFYAAGAEEGGSLSNASNTSTIRGCRKEAAVDFTVGSKPIGSTSTV
jgi:ABC-type dipeptide/oligopeptide/nickel transport system permease subunit